MESFKKGEDGKTILKRALQNQEQDIPVYQAVHLCLTTGNGKRGGKERLGFKKVGSIFLAYTYK